MLFYDFFEIYKSVYPFIMLIMFLAMFALNTYNEFEIEKRREKQREELKLQEIEWRNKNGN